MRRTIRLEGELVDQQTLLDGTRELALEAAGSDEDAAEAWQLTLTLRWPKEAGDSLDEGDLSLTGPDGSSLYGTLRAGSAEDTYDEEIADEVTRLALTFEIRSGDSAFDGFTGRAQVDATLSGETATLTVSLQAEG